MRICTAIIWAAMAGAAPAYGQQERVADQLAPFASDGGKAEAVPARPLDPADDPVNQLVAAGTVDGLVLSVTIDEASITLDGVEPARIPRSSGRREPGDNDDVVIARAYAGGDQVGIAVVGDPIVNAAEDRGIVRIARRQVSIALPASRPATVVEIEAPATGARARLEVSSAYARYCEGNRRDKRCPQQLPD